MKNIVSDKEANIALRNELVLRKAEIESLLFALSFANNELILLNDEKQKRAAELGIANIELAFQDDEKVKRADELIIANKELLFQNSEKHKRAVELGIANIELAFQYDEKIKRADELIIANKELLFQNTEKDKRAAELIIANNELVFQNMEKEKRALELVNANKELLLSEIRLKDSLKETSEYQYALDASTIIAITNQKGIINKANQNFCQISKYSQEELIGKDHRILNSGYHPKEFFQNMWATIGSGKIWKGEIKNKAKDGAFYWVDTTIVPFLNDGIIPNKYVAIRVDITQRKESEEKLKMANQELEFQNKAKEKLGVELVLAEYSRSLIEASLDPLFTISPNGLITDMNQASLQILDRSREQLMGTEFLSYFTEPEKAKAGYEQIFIKGFVTDYPLTMIDGKLTDVLFNGSLYKDGKGKVLGAVVVARDVTEQKRIAKELTEAKVFAELATIIAEEAQAKAEEATRIAKDAVKAKQQFLSNMSHEIRTPMNAIIGFTKVILKTDLTAKQKEYLTAIKMSGDALIVLINDILDLAKVDAGKMIFEKTPFKLSASISAMLHLFESKIEEKNLLLIKEYDENIPDVLIGDPVRLHQIILNLVSNAVKFTNKGQIKVSIKMVNQDDNKVTIKFSVTDTGIGIINNKKAKIFENFQQASSGTSRLYGGTGLGLAIVKQLVENQGGKIEVESKIDVGSEFSFTLAFYKTNVEAEVLAEIVAFDSEVKDIRVLVVEDIALNQLLMRTLLDDFGFQCDIAANGKLAIERLENKEYDIILMDLQMPEMNGFEATDYIRNKMNLKIPIMALTADVTTVDLAKCNAVGMNDYVAKPIDEKILYNKIIGLIKKTTTQSLKINPTVVLDVGNEIKYIDLGYLSHRTKSNPILMKEMILLYLEQTPPLIASMKTSFANKDWGTLKSSVHKMIPSFSIMGMSSEFEVMAKKVQEFADTQHKWEGINELVIQLENVCNQSCHELQEVLINLKHEINEQH
jgi:PAS domain S-box-containing protein